MNVDRIIRTINGLNEFGYTNKGITRLAYSKEEQEARNYLISLCKEEGLEVRIDEVGNVLARRGGLEPSLPPVAFGSHLDSVKQGGRYDGVVGVVAGLEVIRRFNENNIITKHPLELIAFACEESSRFGIATIGSKLMTGAIKKESLYNLKDENGISIIDAMSDCGFKLENCNNIIKGPGDYKIFFELHIEQGPVLKEKNKKIGVVTAIASPTRLKVSIEGKASHSGTTPICLRRDALLGACEIVLSTEKAAKEEFHNGSVATVGVLKVAPGVMNVVPGLVELHIDIRGIYKESKELIVKKIKESFEKIRNRRGLTIKCDTMSEENPIFINEKIVRELITCCSEMGITYTKITSGGGHDAMNMMNICDVGLMFIPSENGIGHNPDEFTNLEDIIVGIDLLEKIIGKYAVILK